VTALSSSYNPTPAVEKGIRFARAVTSPVDVPWCRRRFSTIVGLLDHIDRWHLPDDTRGLRSRPGRSTIG
jgi:hypothetical protein